MKRDYEPFEIEFIPMQKEDVITASFARVVKTDGIEVLLEFSKKYV